VPEDYVVHAFDGEEETTFPLCTGYAEKPLLLVFYPKVMQNKTYVNHKKL
jgi:hypothetical protein